MFGSGRQVSQVSALVSGSSGLGSSPRSGHRFVFLGKTIESCVDPSPNKVCPGREGGGGTLISSRVLSLRSLPTSHHDGRRNRTGIPKRLAENRALGRKGNEGILRWINIPFSGSNNTPDVHHLMWATSAREQTK